MKNKLYKHTELKPWRQGALQKWEYACQSFKEVTILMMKSKALKIIQFIIKIRCDPYTCKAVDLYMRILTFK